MSQVKKRRRRIRYGKLFLFLVILFIGVFFFALGARKGYAVVSSVLLDKAQKPSYYLVGGINDSNQAASVFLVAEHANHQELTVLGIPGNTKINRNDAPAVLLKNTYQQGGMEETKNAVENLLHIRIDKYMVLSYDSFVEAMRHMDPIDLYVEKDMAHTDRNGAPDISLRQGYQALTGNTALEYMRYLEEPDEEILRVQRQQRFIRAGIEKLKDRPCFVNWLFVRHYWSPAESNITAGEAADLIYYIGNIKNENIHYMILPGEQKRESTLVSFWSMNPVEVQRVIGTILITE
ncbi:MAG: LCP family protein [Dialister sp.]|nr:LCP family protein [Dialister sp.]